MQDDDPLELGEPDVLPPFKKLATLHGNVVDVHFYTDPLEARIKELDGKLEERSKRIEALEARLELQLYHTPDVLDQAGEMVPAEKIDIGDLDGIGCRNETIKILDKNVRTLREVRADLESRLDACQSSRQWLQEQNDVEQKAAAELRSRLSTALKIVSEAYYAPASESGRLLYDAMQTLQGGVVEIGGALLKTEIVGRGAEHLDLQVSAVEKCGVMFPPGQFAVQQCTLPKGHVGEHANTVKGL